MNIISGNPENINKHISIDISHFESVNLLLKCFPSAKTRAETKQAFIFYKIAHKANQSTIIKIVFIYFFLAALRKWM